MSGGGGNAVTTQEPWPGVQPYMTSGYNAAYSNYANPNDWPQFYPGQTWIGANPFEQAGWNQQLSFAQQTLPSMIYPQLGAQHMLATGGAPSAGYLGSMLPMTQSNLSTMFHGPTQLWDSAPYVSNPYPYYNPQINPFQAPEYQDWGGSGTQFQMYGPTAYQGATGAPPNASIMPWADEYSAQVSQWDTLVNALAEGMPNSYNPEFLNFPGGVTLPTTIGGTTGGDAGANFPTSTTQGGVTTEIYPQAQPTQVPIAPTGGGDQLPTYMPKMEYDQTIPQFQTLPAQYPVPEQLDYGYKSPLYQIGGKMSYPSPTDYTTLPADTGGVTSHTDYPATSATTNPYDPTKAPINWVGGTADGITKDPVLQDLAGYPTVGTINQNTFPTYSDDGQYAIYGADTTISPNYSNQFNPTVNFGGLTSQDLMGTLPDPTKSTWQPGQKLPGVGAEPGQYYIAPQMQKDPSAGYPFGGPTAPTNPNWYPGSGWTENRTAMNPSMPFDFTGAVGNVNIDPTQFADATRVINQDPNAALAQQLSGQADYGGLADALRAYAQPTMDMLTDDILPQLRSQAVGSNNPTGEIKGQNYIVPKVMRDISQQGQRMAYDEMQAAKARQSQAMNLATQAGLNQTNLAASLGGQQAGLDQGTMSQMLQAMQGGSGLNLNAAMANLDSQNQYRQQALGLAGLTSGLTNQYSQDLLRGMSMFPQYQQAGFMPGQTMASYGSQFLRPFDEAALNEDMSRYNYYQNLPQQQLSQYMGHLSGASGLGGVTTQQMADNELLGGLGGALSGAGLAQVLGATNPWILGGSALLGGLAGIL